MQVSLKLALVLRAGVLGIHYHILQTVNMRHYTNRIFFFTVLLEMPLRFCWLLLFSLLGFKPVL